MKDSRIAPDVLCPFYVDDLRVRIRCEGCIDESLYTHMIFEDVNKKMEYMRNKCCDKWGSCTVCALLMRKYNEQV